MTPTLSVTTRVSFLQVWRSLFGLEKVFVRPRRVPSLALLAALCMVHFALVVLPVTHHTCICDVGKP